MKIKIFMGAAIAALFLFVVTTAEAHSGRTNAQGCHMDKKAGKRHCHGKKPSQSTYKPQPSYSNGTVYYPNCTAAKNAGKSNIRRGQPGYGRHLDRDNDGVACES